MNISIPNPDLFLKLKDGEYHLTGKIAATSKEATSTLDYREGSHLWVLKVVLMGDIDPNHFMMSIYRDEDANMITYDKFNGTNFTYIIFDSSVKTISISYEINSKEGAKNFKIYNEAIDT